MKEETIVKLVAFLSVVVMYIVTVFKTSPTPDTVQALFTAAIGLITTVVGYNIGKEVGKRRTRR